MRHARKDYERFQDPALKDRSLLGVGCKPIAEDEPVFLLRAQDGLAPHTLLDYAMRAQDAGLFDVAETTRRQAVAMREWQDREGCKLPDLPGQPPVAVAPPSPDPALALHDPAGVWPVPPMRATPLADPEPAAAPDGPAAAPGAAVEHERESGR